MREPWRLGLCSGEGGEHANEPRISTDEDITTAKRATRAFWKACAYGEVVEEEGEGPSDAEYIASARDMYAVDGQVEIDEGAMVSRGDERGAYVAAWVWVAEPAPQGNASSMHGGAWVPPRKEHDALTTSGR